MSNIDPKKVADIYFENSIITAPPYKLTLLLYQGCIRFIRLAKLYKDIDIEKSIHYNYKAQTIMNELILSSIKGSTSPFISLYHFIHRQLIDFHIHKNTTFLDNAEEILLEIKDTWEQVIRKAQQSKSLSK